MSSLSLSLSLSLPLFRNAPLIESDSSPDRMLSTRLESLLYTGAQTQRDYYVLADSTKELTARVTLVAKMAKAGESGVMSMAGRRGAGGAGGSGSAAWAGGSGSGGGGSGGNQGQARGNGSSSSSGGGGVGRRSSSNGVSGRGGTGRSALTEQQEAERQHQQRLSRERLFFLLHSRSCTVPENQPCRFGDQCKTFKRLWRHMGVCKINLTPRPSTKCPVPHCSSSKVVYWHYRTCREGRNPGRPFKDCLICPLVLTYLRRSDKDFVNAERASARHAASAKGGAGGRGARAGDGRGGAGANSECGRRWKF